MLLYKQLLPYISFILVPPQLIMRSQNPNPTSNHYLLFGNVGARPVVIAFHNVKSSEFCCFVAVLPRVLTESLRASVAVVEVVVLDVEQEGDRGEGSISMVGGCSLCRDVLGMVWREVVRLTLSGGYLSQE